MVRKCSETVVGLEILEGLSTGLRCSLKRSLSRRLVSPMYCLEHCIILATLKRFSVEPLMFVTRPSLLTDTDA